MKKTLLLSFLISIALVCSCQKQDSTAEQQLAQRKTELDAREKALDEREKALAQQEKLVARRRPAPMPRPAPAVPQRTVPADLQGLMNRMQEIQRKRASEVRGNAGTVPATEQAASPSQSPTPE